VLLINADTETDGRRADPKEDKTWWMADKIGSIDADLA
jgi:hypothetical protein